MARLGFGAAALGLLLLTAASLAGCPWSDGGASSAPEVSSDPRDWPMYNRDVAGSRYAPEEDALTAATARGIVEKWRFPAKGERRAVGAIHATPSVVNGHVYFGTATWPAFYKLRPDGSLAWVYRPDGGRGSGVAPAGQAAGAPHPIRARRSILSSALVTGTRVFFGDAAGVFYCLRRATGEELWRVDTRAADFPEAHPANTFASSPILADGKVVVGGGANEHRFPLDPDYACCTGRGLVIAFDPASGATEWIYAVGPEPEPFDPPVVLEDGKGRHTFRSGPATSSVWSTPSYDAESRTVFFGTDVHNAPRRPTPDDPRYDTRYSSAVIAVDVGSGAERWVTQIRAGNVFHYGLAAWDSTTGTYKDQAVGDTPKLGVVDVGGVRTKVVGAGCKDGGYYVLRAADGALLASTPTYEGAPRFPLDPPPDPRMLALPSPIGGLQTGCATDGERVFTNGIDHLLMGRGKPTGGRVVCLDVGATRELWRHDRPPIDGKPGLGDPVGAGIAVAGGVAWFTTTVSHRLVGLEAATGEVLVSIPIGIVWSGPSISRGRVYVGTGSILFFKKRSTGVLHSFGLPAEDEVDRMGRGDE